MRFSIACGIAESLEKACDIECNVRPVDATETDYFVLIKNLPVDLKINDKVTVGDLERIVKFLKEVNHV